MDNFNFGKIPVPTDSAGLRFLYHTVPGRLLLKAASSEAVSVICGHLLDSRPSVVLIKPFIRRNRIDMNDYEDERYSSFNDFFTRHIKPERRPIDPDPSHFIAPCDGLLSAYRIKDGLVIPVKQSRYSINSLLGKEGGSLAERYENGTCLVFRLCVNHYHRYAYAETGAKGPDNHIKGILHTVRPIALEDIPVFTQNSREYTVIESGTAGTVVQMEVGAMLVGKIENYEGATTAVRGKEKGRFLYGGSTVIVLTEKDRVIYPDELYEAAALGYEIPVRMGQAIGTVACR